MGRSGEVEWEAALACLVVLVELALGLWLVSRGHGPLWCRAALAAVGLWFALAAGFVHSMAVYDVWL